MQAQILIEEGKTLAEATGVARQEDVKLNGHALQCRVTTEDPQNNFIPDYGRLTAYRSATGNGIRLDGGTAYAGGVITRYYDSLLVKVTAHAQTPEKAIARMDRALREFRIRGVSTNIDFVINLLKHPTFLNDTYTTKFIDTTPELFQFRKRQDRATKILTYIADITVNGHPETAGRAKPAAELRTPKPPALRGTPQMGTRNLLEQKGPQAVADWMKAQKKVLITDTTMRDGHQSAAGHADALDRHDPGGPGLCRQPAAICSASNAGAAPPSTWPTASCRNARGSACATCARPCPT